MTPNYDKAAAVAEYTMWIPMIGFHDREGDTLYIDYMVDNHGVARTVLKTVLLLSE